MYPAKPLGEIIKISKGKKVYYSPEKGKYSYIDIGILRTGLIEQYTNDEGVVCDKKDILIAWDGSKSGTTGFGLEGVIGSTLAKLKLKDENISTEFVGKFLQSNFDYLNKNTSGAAIPHLRKDILENLQIPLPPLPTQQKIVEKLDKIFAKIDKNIELTKQNISNIEEENKSILEKIFKECEEEFGVEKLGEILDIRDGTHDSPKFFENGKALITSKNLKDSKIDFSNIKYISNEDFEKINKRSKVDKGDMLFAMIGTIGNPTIIDFEPNFAIKNVALFKSNEKIILMKFIKYFFLNSFVQKKMLSESKGATQKFVGLGYLRNFQILLPPLPVQQEIVEKLDKIFAKNSELKVLYEKNLKNLENLKQSILKQAFEDENFIQ